MNILTIKTSGRGNESVSNQLIDEILKNFKKKIDVDIRDEDLTNLTFVNELQVKGELSDHTISYLENINWADTIVIGCPIYNFNVPGKLKSWFDQIVIAGKTFNYTSNGPVGLLSNKKAIVVYTSGGTGMNSEIDFATPWIKFVLNFIGINEISFVSADQVALNYSDSIKSAHQDIEKLFS